MQTLLVTIVIPTHNRHHLLGKALRHYDAFGVPVLVVDSTQEVFTQLAGLQNVEYLHRPNEPMPHKLRTPIIERVHTPYLVMSADDSFTSLSGIRASLDFLEAHSDHSSCQGYFFGYWDRGEEVSLDVYYRTLETLDGSVDAERPEDRLIQMFTRFSAIFYAVYRTDCQKEMLSRFPDSVRSHSIAEFYFAMMTALHGKHALLPVFYQLQEHAPAVDTDPAFRSDMQSLATKPRYAAEFEAFLQAVTAYLSELSGRRPEEARIFVLKAVALQAWQRKQQKSLGDRLRAEWQAFLNRTVLKARKRECSRLRRQAEAEEMRRLVATVREKIGPTGQAEMDALVESLLGRGA